MLADVIDYLNKNSGALTVIFSAVVTASTMAYAVLTWKLVTETERMRQVQTEPRIEITLKSLDYAVNVVRLHIRNIGFGPAVDVTFNPTVVSGGGTGQSLLKEFSRTNFFRTGLKYLGPGQERYSGYTQMTRDTEAKLESVLAFDIEYGSITGKRYQDHVILDMSEHKGTYRLGTPNLHSIAKSLEEIQKQISQLVGGNRKINVDIYDAEDRAKEEDESLAYINRLEEDREKK